MTSFLAAVSARSWLVLLGLASAAALATAYALQYLGGFEPCQMCYWQRYPYMAVIGVAVIGVASRFVRLGLLLVLVLFLTGAGLAAWHVGVEQGVFALPSGCAVIEQATSVEELRAQLRAAPPACDQVSVSFLGLSLSAWSGIAAFLLAAVTFGALWRDRQVSY
jgi:disulfide bond formation protein DsbB